MTTKIIFFNTGWMDFYRGLRNDKISGGGWHVDKFGYGWEIFNFKKFKNNLYGFVRPKSDEKFKNPSTIKLEKLEAKKTDESISGVTVVWTATDPHNGGTYIIGWYKNATVFRHYQDPPHNSNRRYRNDSMGYYATTNIRNAKLLSIDERVVKVKRQKKNWMGQSNVWYADNNPKFVTLVKDYIFKGKLPIKTKRSRKLTGKPRQIDVLKRIRIEKKAILHVTKYYKRLGYKIQSFEKDNIGWDLTATNSRTALKLEVKGLSSSSIATELTPNEFKNLKKDKAHYRLCIVTNVLTKPKLKIFAHSGHYNAWVSEDGTVLQFENIVSARIYV